MNRGLLIGIIVVLLACCCLVVAGVAIVAGTGGLALFGAVSGPNQTFNAYYDAVKAEDWPRAYAQLSSDFQDSKGESDIRDAFLQAAQKEGKIKNVRITNTQVINDTATIEAEVEREKTTGRVKATLVKEGDKWRIDGFGS